jgi:signal transduction histidine kinase
MDTPEAVNILYVLLAGSAGMLVLGAAVVFFFVSYYRRNAKAREEFYRLQTKHQEDLILSNLQTLEDERKRFAEDLHDEIGAALSAIRLHVSRLESGNPPVSGEPIKNLKEIIDHAMASTRRISHNMLPPGLEMFGLAHVAKDLEKQVPEGPVQVHIQAANGLPRLPYNTELTLYRILQELMNNTIKHARASTITIDLLVRDGHFVTSYRDNGIGFDLAGVRFTGLGLSNVQNRAKMVNGMLDFTTAPGQGLHVEVRIPLNEGTHA